MIKFVLGCGFAVLLAGCGTSVPLNDVPVSDGTVKPVISGISGLVSGSAGAAPSGGVAQVDVSKSGAQTGTTSGPNVVYFDFDSFVIKPEFQSLITTQAQIIKSQPSRKTALEGHADERGGREYNLALGQKRAEAVANALSILGVSQNQIEAVSFGEEKPASIGTDEQAYSKNRRVEIRAQ